MQIFKNLHIAGVKKYHLGLGEEDGNALTLKNIIFKHT
jgi:hypothetical protein